MKLVITGGGGFLGYHICQQLAKNYDEVVVVDIAAIDSSEYPANVKSISCDVRNKDALEQILKGTDHLIHAAASLPLCSRDDIFETNVLGTQNALEGAAAHNIKRIVVISSTAVYGVPEKHPILESDPLQGVGPYGESKIKSEELCDNFRANGLCITTVRPKTFVGTGRLGVFQILYDWIECGKKIPIIGNGKNLYQLLEVEDLVSAIALALSASEANANDIFNVGAQKFGTVEEDVGALCRYAKTNARVFPTPASLMKFLLAVFETLNWSPLYKWVYGTADKDSYVSTDKIQDKLGWKPQYSNAEALIRSYQWYLDHKQELSGEGVTHRVAWKQGVLALFKKIL